MAIIVCDECGRDFVSTDLVVCTCSMVLCYDCYYERKHNKHDRAGDQFADWDICEDEEYSGEDQYDERDVGEN